MSRAVSAAARVAPELTVYGVLRSGLVLAGILLLAVGLGDMITGRTKVVQYHAALAQTPTEPVDPTALFPTSNEGAERRGVVAAKLAFYELLVTVGEVLAAGGFALVAAGVLRAGVRSARAAQDPASSR